MPQNFLRVVRFFTSSSLFLALNSALVVYFSFILYEIEVSPLILLAAFLSTFAVYSLNKVTDKTEDSINKPEQTTKAQKYYLIPSIVSCIISLAIGLMEGPLVFLVLLTPLIVGFVYSVKISKLLPRLKEVLGVKSVLVAFSWAFTGSFLPALMGFVTAEKIFLVFMYIFIQLFVNTVLFDVLDMSGDGVSQVKTIPLRLGKTRTAHLLFLANSLLLLWLVCCFVFGLFLRYLPAAAFGVFYGYGLIWYFTKNSGKRLSAELMVDGEWLPIVAFLGVIAR
jgi:4-hydroxybenzoate polyprenyltransferase